MVLDEFFKNNKKIALAFSGGTDSTFLLWAAVQSGADVKAYFVKSCFQPKFEYNDVRHITTKFGVDLKVIETDLLKDESIRMNPAERCYICKKKIFSLILDEAKKDGDRKVIDGTNASDSYDDRPGMAALEELNIASPLRDCGLTKSEIRKLSKSAGLSTYDKPPYACLATRVPTGMEITEELLSKVETSESMLFAMGYTDFRVRICDEHTAKLQFLPKEIVSAFKEREDIVQALSESFDNVLLDLRPRETN
ncbi:MAG: ATP-dependent sacrificial sulfur transferase LarE [Clostridiales bacterium]|nr:ATP-dependent sacrificial sulfur transferase LarE [Clostridiales bacterium]